MGLRAREAEVIRKRLNSCGFPNRQGAVLVGMDVPIAVLRDVRRDRSAQSVPRQTFVLIREHVRPISPQIFWEVDIGLPLAEQPKGSHIVVADVSTDVV